MGYKRSFCDVEVQELPYKQQKQLDYSNKVTSFADASPRKHDISDGSFSKAHRTEDLPVSIMTDEDVKSITSFSWFTNKSTSEEDGFCTKEADPSPLSKHFESLPTKLYVQLEDNYLSFIDRYPRKQVPIGPNCQASIPEWGIEEPSDPLESSQQLARLQGTCVVPLLDSDLSDPDLKNVGKGRKDCNCLDQGSVRCVRQHIVEAREKLKRTCGLKFFIEAGFGKMGEAVASKWSEEEEQIFHEVVFTNPESMGVNFWKHLAVELPSRSRRELVSYYFNVFMLRRRAGQNHCSNLDIDSDDDEWHGSDTDSLKVAVMEEGEDSEIDSLADEDDCSSDEDDCSSSDDDDGDGNGEVGHCSTIDAGENQLPDAIFSDNLLGNQDDSCLSFDYQHTINNSDNPSEAEYIMHYDVEYMTGLDLLSTFNMMEEFFGPESWKSDDKLVD